VHQKVISMAIEYTEQEAIEAVAGTTGGNSGISEAKKILWAAFAEDLTEFLNAQLSKGYDKRLMMLDIRTFCERLNMQPGALKNKMRGFAVSVKQTGSANARVLTAKVVWLAGDESVSFLEKVNAHMATNPENRLMGGLALKGAAVWNGKRYPIAKRGKDTYKGEDTPILHVLTISKYWRSASSKHKSN
jgi:hypothetical protein